MKVYDVLQQSLASIRCTCSYQLYNEKEVQMKSRVMLVGTMKSIFKGSIATVDVELKPLLNDFEDLIVRNATGIVFPVDSFTGEGIVELRKAILDVASNKVDKGECDLSPMCEVKLPVPTVALDLLLRSEDKSIISFECCKELAKDCNIDPDTELTHVLWQLYHITGSIRYYHGDKDEILEQHVVTNPQVLYDAPSSLLTHTFALKKGAELDGEEKEIYV